MAVNSWSEGGLRYVENDTYLSVRNLEDEDVYVDYNLRRCEKGKHRFLIRPNECYSVEKEVWCSTRTNVPPTNVYTGYDKIAIRKPAPLPRVRKVEPDVPVEIEAERFIDLGDI